MAPGIGAGAIPDPIQKNKGRMRMNLRNAVAMLSLALAAGTVSAGDKETVDYRKNTMKIIGGHMGSLVAIIKGEVPHGDDLAYHATGLAAAAPKVLTVFEAEAMNDDSTALPDIWKDWAAYEKAAKRLETTSTDLAAAVAGGNKAAVGAALGEVGKSCKGCHDNFTKDQ